MEYGIYAPFMLQGLHYAIYALGGVLCQKHEEHKIDVPNADVRRSISTIVHHSINRILTTMLSAAAVKLVILPTAY